MCPKNYLREGTQIGASVETAEGVCLATTLSIKLFQDIFLLAWSQHLGGATGGGEDGRQIWAPHP